MQEHARQNKKQNLKKHPKCEHFLGWGRRGGQGGLGKPTSYASEEYFLGMVVKVVSEIAHSRRLQKETCTTLSRPARLRHPSAKLQVAPAGTFRRFKCMGGRWGRTRGLRSLALNGLRRVSDSDVSLVFLQYFLPRPSLCSLPIPSLNSGTWTCPDTPRPHFSNSKPPSQTPVFTTLPPPSFAFPLVPNLLFWMVKAMVQEGDFFHKETQTFHYSDLGKYKGKIHP